MVKEKKVINNDFPRIEVNPELKQIYMTGALGGFTPHDFRLVIINEKSKADKNGQVNLVPMGNYELILSHTAIKELHDFLSNHIESFEKVNGEIKSRVVKPDI